MVKASDLKSDGFSRAGSNPVPGVVVFPTRTGKFEYRYVCFQ